MSKRERANHRIEEAKQAGAVPPEGKAETSRQTHADVSHLPAELQQLVGRMLIEGATVEDVVETLDQRGAEGVTQQAVENFFRSNLPLQRQRIQRQLETAKVLKQALLDARSNFKEMADAVFLTGLMRVTRQGANFDIRLAMKERLERENLALRQRVLRMRLRDSLQKESYGRMKMRTEVLRHQKAKIELDKLKDALRVVRKGGKLDDQALQKIREIYGLITEPIVPSDAETSSAQA